MLPPIPQRGLDQCERRNRCGVGAKNARTERQPHHVGLLEQRRSFLLGDVHPHDVGTILDRHGVAVRAGHHCAQPLMRCLGVGATSRASFAIHSGREEVDRLIDGLGTVQEVFA